MKKSKKGTKYSRASRLTCATTAALHGSLKNTRLKSSWARQQPQVSHWPQIPQQAFLYSPHPFCPILFSFTFQTLQKHSNLWFTPIRTQFNSKFRPFIRNLILPCITMAFVIKVTVFSISMESYIRFLWFTVLLHDILSWHTGGNFFNWSLKGWTSRTKRNSTFSGSNCELWRKRVSTNTLECSFNPLKMRWTIIWTWVGTPMSSWISNSTCSKST